MSDCTYTNAVHRWYKCDLTQSAITSTILEDWCKENCATTEYVRLGKKVWFQNEDHALFCKLRWM